MRKLHYHRGPCSLSIRSEIKVSSTVPNRVKAMYCKMFATVMNREMVGHLIGLEIF